MRSLDVAVIVAYFAAVIVFGLVLAGRQRSASDYFLGHRGLPWWALMMSVVATETSALTVISIPGIAARGNLTWLQVTFGYLVGRIGGSSGINTLAEWIATQFDASANWRDVEWVRSRWPGKLIMKGVLDAEDARLAVAAGADAIVVSNHGGRQLDGAPSSISVLVEIVEAVGAQCEVMFDGGVRSGQDIAKALALGARAALIGKSFLYALSAAGEAGVTKAVEIMRNELRVTLALTGTASVDAVGPQILR